MHLIWIRIFFIAMRVHDSDTYTRGGGGMLYYVYEYGNKINFKASGWSQYDGCRNMSADFKWSEI